VVIISQIHIELDGGGGNIHVTMPYSMLEPIRELLDAGIQSDRSDVDTRWAEALQNEVRTVPIDLTATLARTKMSLRDVMYLKKGDIIPIERPDLATVWSEGLALFKGSYGIHNNQMAVKIEERYERPEHVDLGLPELSENNDDD